jgi:hypothetical protein
MVGEEPDPLSLDKVKRVGKKYLDSRNHAARGLSGCGSPWKHTDEGNESFSEYGHGVKNMCPGIDQLVLRCPSIQRPAITVSALPLIFKG